MPFYHEDGTVEVRDYERIPPPFTTIFTLNYDQVINLNDVMADLELKYSRIIMTRILVQDNKDGRYWSYEIRCWK